MMNEIIVDFAQLRIKIKSRFEYMKTFCKDYLVDGEDYDFEIMVDDQAIKKMKQELAFSDDYSESLAIYEAIANKLVDYNGIVMHGACIKYLDYGLLFSAPSGTGKSTHIRLWKQYFKDQVDIINGDKPILRFFDDEIRIYGTPYSGKENWHKNQSAKLKAICLLKQGKENQIKKLEPKEAMVAIFAQMYIAKKDEATAIKTIMMLDQLLQKIPIYELTCNISYEAVEVCYQGLKGELSEND